MSRFTWLVSVGLAFSVCGCIIDKPLSDPKTSKVDERLLGRWEGVVTKANPDAADSLMYIGRHAVAGNPTGIMEGLTVDYDDKAQKIIGVDSNRVGYFSHTKVGEMNLINVFYEDVAEKEDPREADLSSTDSYEKWSKNPKRSVCLIRYVFDGETVKFYLADPVKLDDLAKNGKLKRADDNIISADSLAAYMAKSGSEGLFFGEDDVMIYKKLK
jgi:hypothetical protein